MPSTPLPTPEAFARTYYTPSYENPFDAVEDYQRYLEVVSEHPNLGSYALASLLNLPRGRVRPWTNGARPDVVRGLQIAEVKGWLSNTNPTPERERALVELAAWVLSSGSLSISRDTGARISFVLDDDRRKEFAVVASKANLDFRLVHETDTERATEARPSEAGSVLARVLHAMGVPAGGKSATRPIALPEFVRNLDTDARAAFALVYVKNRAVGFNTKDTLIIQEERSDTYLEDIAVLLRSLTDEAVTRGENKITVSAAAARELLDSA